MTFIHPINHLTKSFLIDFLLMSVAKVSSKLFQIKAVIRNSFPILTINKVFLLSGHFNDFKWLCPFFLCFRRILCDFRYSQFDACYALFCSYLQFVAWSNKVQWIFRWRLTISLQYERILLSFYPAVILLHFYHARKPIKMAWDLLHSTKTFNSNFFQLELCKLLYHTIEDE